MQPTSITQARHPFVLDERKNRKPLQMSAPVGIFKDPYQRGQGAITVVWRRGTSPHSRLEYPRSPWRHADGSRTAYSSVKLTQDNVNILDMKVHICCKICRMCNCNRVSVALLSTRVGIDISGAVAGLGDTGRAGAGGGGGGIAAVGGGGMSVLGYLGD